MSALAPRFEPRRLESLEEVRVGIAWLDDADPLVRARVEEAAERFPRRTIVELPSTEGTYAEFMHEVADVHRELFAEHADAYGENVRPKIERCLAVTDAEAEAARTKATAQDTAADLARMGIDPRALGLQPEHPARVGDGATGTAPAPPVGEVQAANAPASSLHCVGSLAVNVNVADLELLGSLGFPAVIATVGGIESIVQVYASWSALPTESVALTVNVCGPWARSE